MYSRTSKLRNRSVIFYGRFPALGEVGGVTTFTFNVANSFQENNIKYVDLYNSKDKKIPLNTKVIFLSKYRLLKAMQFLRYVLNPNTVHFFNFSSVAALVAFAFLPKIIGSRWIGIFHHGEQAKEFEKLNIFFRSLSRFGIRRFDRIGYLSAKQLHFFSKFFKGELLHITPHIPSSGYVDNTLKVSPSKTSILISGFPSSIYRISETLSVLSNLYNKGNILSVSVCIYGVSNLSEKNNLLSDIKKTVKLLPWVRLYSHLDSNEFMKVMQNCNLYLRMNSTDSFGLAVAEAIDNGLNVIATNVCERYPGTYLIGVDDFKLLETSLAHYFNGGSLSTFLKIEKQTNEKTTISKFIFT